MYRSIIVPLDGSSFSEHALPIATALARRSGAALRLVVVYERLVHALDLPGAEIYDTSFDTGQIRDRTGYVTSLAELLTIEESLSVSAVVLDERGIAKAIANEATRAKGDLIVMTTHGRGGLDRAWMGSVADELTRYAPRPLLLVRPASSTLPSAMASTVGHVLIPLDGSELAERAIEPALVLAGLTTARVSLLRVVTTPDTLLPAEETFWTPAERKILDSQRVMATQYADVIAARVAENGAAVHTAVTLAPEPARAILAYAAAHDVDLIAISTHARAGLERMLIGSVTDKVVRGGTGMTLVVGSPAGR